MSYEPTGRVPVGGQVPSNPQGIIPLISLPRGDLQAQSPGVPVFAFYHANDHGQGFRFVKVLHKADLKPICGLFSGWLRGSVASHWDPSSYVEGDWDTWVHVRFEGNFRDPGAGHEQAIEMRVHPALVIEEQESGKQPPAPTLSILSVRWWDYWSNQTWSDYSITNDGMIRDLFDGSHGVHQVLPGEYEVYTIYVRHNEDLDRISAAWAQAVLRGSNTVAWYFLWPNMHNRADEQGGCICERRFFALCQRMERAGVRSAWPHPSQLYRLLCGKLWVPQMSLNKDFCVPPTTRVHYASTMATATSLERVASEALLRLLALRREIWGWPDVPVDELMGVVKLGFSWQGNDVLPFKGLKLLISVLERLYEQRHSNQLLCLVQMMVPSVVCEYRFLCFHDALNETFVKEPLWMRMKAGGEHHQHQEVCKIKSFQLASAKVLSRDEALKEFFGGDLDALVKVEDKTAKLVNKWLLWFSTECAEPPQVTRLDFLVSYSKGSEPSVFTCEVGECGASLCSVECDARNAASLNWAMRDDTSGRFPKPIPPITRNNGWKS